MLLKDKIGIVTGGARGLGKAYAEAMLQRRAKAVVILDVLEDVGKETVAEFQSLYGPTSAIFFNVDVTDEERMTKAFDDVMKMYGRIDVLINNAGLGPGNECDRILDTNLRGTVRGTELAIARMRTDQGGTGGVIINIASIAAVFALTGGPYYQASKHAIMGYTRAIGLQLGDLTGIKFRVLCPGPVKTEICRRLMEMEKQGEADEHDGLKAAGGWVKVVDVANACMALIQKDDLPQNTACLVTADGSFLVFPEDAPKKKIG